MTINLKSISVKSEIKCRRVDCENDILNFVFQEYLHAILKFGGEKEGKEPFPLPKKSQ